MELNFFLKTIPHPGMRGGVTDFFQIFILDVSFVLGNSSFFWISHKLVEPAVTSLYNHNILNLLETSFASIKIFWNSGRTFIFKLLLFMYFSSLSALTLSTISWSSSRRSVFTINSIKVNSIPTFTT